MSSNNGVVCPYCNGNDKDMPCAYPSENKKGCLRDKRKKDYVKFTYIDADGCENTTTVIFLANHV